MDKKKQPAKKKAVRSGAGISGSKRAEEALSKSEERYRSILDQMQDTYHELDLAGKFTFVSESATRSFGYSQEELIGQSYRLAMPEEDVKGAVAAFNEVYRTGQPNKGFVHRIRHRDGSTSFSEASVDLNRDAQGKVTGFKVINRDISERKKAEAELLRSEGKYRSLVENINDVFYILDNQGNITYVSPVVERFTMYKVSDLIGKPFIPLIYPDDLPGLLDSFNRLVSGQLEPWEFRIVDKDGRVIFVRTSSRPIYENGQMVGITALITDISERKKAEEALEQVNREQSTIMDFLPDATFAINNDRKVVFWNRALEEMSGVLASDMIGRGDYAYTVPFYGEARPFLMDLIWEDSEDVRSRYSNILKEGDSFVAEVFCPALYGGKGAWVYAKAAPLYDRDKNIVGAIESVRDITERRRAEEALQESEARYRLLADHMTDTVWLTDMQLKPTYQSPSAVKLRGFTQQELLEMPPEKHVTPESLKVLTEAFFEDMAKLEAGLDYDYSRTLDLEFYRKDGSTFWSETTFSFIRDANGKPIGVLGEGRDISLRKKAEQALKESEEKYRIVVENAMEAIFVAADGMIKFANHRATVLSGYSQEEFTSRPFIDFIHPDDRQTEAERHIQLLQGMDVPYPYTFRIFDKSGNLKWVEISTALITWEGKPATLNFLTDVTDRKRLEEEQQRVARLESVGLLAGGIAHDFNNILTAILGNISLAGMEAAPGSELQNSLDQAEKASLRAKDLTRQLLTFSKGGAPVLKLASLTELLRDTAVFALRGSNVKCLFSIPADLWHAEIDAGQVSQVIHNLVINAQQAMPTGGTIGLTAENMALGGTQSIGKGLPLKAGAYIRIAVTDHGTGIPADHLEKIFDPFFSTKQKGSGLGLATSFSIAHQHGGYISVESAPGAGSTFYLYLPASTQIVTPEPAQKEATKAVGRARVLVMDDEQGVREIAGRLLQHIGYQDVVFTSDGAGAIKLYKASMKSGQPFTVAILDLTIAGGMGGKETIRKLLKVDPGVKAIVSSGYADDPVIAKYRDFGFSGMVAKPYTIEELRKALQDVME